MLKSKIIVRDADVWLAPWENIERLVLAIIEDIDDDEEDNEEKMSKKLKEGEL